MSALETWLEGDKPHTDKDRRQPDSKSTYFY